MMGLQPLQDWALIEPSEAKEKTTAGLFIPDTAKEKPVEGKVLAVGTGRWDTPEKKFGRTPKKKEEKIFTPTVLKPGDHVLYENTERPKSIWMGRNSFLFASPTSWVWWDKEKARVIA